MGWIRGNDSIQGDGCGGLPVLTVLSSADGPQGTGPAQDLHWLDEQWP